MIRDQFIEQCLSTRLRRRLLREPDLTLEKTMAIGRSFEASERQASQIEVDSLKTTNLEVNAIRSAQDTKSPRPRFPAATTAQTGRSNIIQLLDETEQNIVIYQWRANQLFADAEGRGK